MHFIWSKQNEIIKFERKPKLVSRKTLSKCVLLFHMGFAWENPRVTELLTMQKGWPNAILTWEVRTRVSKQSLHSALAVNYTPLEYSFWKVHGIFEQGDFWNEIDGGKSSFYGVSQRCACRCGSLRQETHFGFFFFKLKYRGVCEAWVWIMTAAFQYWKEGFVRLLIQTTKPKFSLFFL